MKHIMLDLETLGNNPNSVIVAIGAVAFDSNGITDEFYCAVDSESCVQSGLTMDASTVEWWMEQSVEARAVFADENKVSIQQALLNFSEFCGKDDFVWGNGASFDNVILSNAYKKCRLPQPWMFWNDRCYRTIKSIYRNLALQRIGTYHNALHDAESQARHLIEINKVHGFIL